MRGTPTFARDLTAGRSRWWWLLAVLAAASCHKLDHAGPAGPAPEIIKNHDGSEMVLVPTGRFMMGSDQGEPDQAPAHEVWVDAFLIDRCEVTQGLFAKLVPVNGSHFKDPKRPVEMISWPEAALYCNKRSLAEGLRPCYNEETAACDFTADGYRLPTEAEWEYACRAGGDAEYSFGPEPRQLKQYAWFADNAARETHPAATKKPNAWGLFDMHGNVAEWCNDIYDKDYYQASPNQNPRGPAEGKKYVLRGGAWNGNEKTCTAAYRAAEDPGFCDACFARDAIGFRCVRKAPVTMTAAKSEEK